MARLFIDSSAATGRSTGGRRSRAAGSCRRASPHLSMKPAGCGFDPLAAGDALGRVARRAVALGVARDAGVQVAHRLPGVVVRARGARWSTRRAGGGSGGRPAGCRSGSRGRRRCGGGSRRRRSARRGSSSSAGCRCAPPAGASRASRWGAPCAGRTLPSWQSVHSFAVWQLAAEGAVVGGDGLVALDPVGVVRRRRGASAAGTSVPVGVRRLHAPVRLREVAGGAGALGVALRPRRSCRGR